MCLSSWDRLREVLYVDDSDPQFHPFLLLLRFKARIQTDCLHVPQPGKTFNIEHYCL